jgi:RNA polymerase sigma factor (sigma-70 family)
MLATASCKAHPRGGYLYPLSEHEPDRARWFLEEVHAHDSSLRAYLRGSFPLVRDVDDVVQESYARVWKARPSEPIRSAKAFLFRVARHLAIDWLRRDRVSPIDGVTDFADLCVLDDRPSVAESACVREETGLLLAAIDALPSRCREIVILRKLRGLSQKEIAALLGLSEQTVQVQIARGVKKCDKFLRSYGVKR